MLLNVMGVVEGEGYVKFHLNVGVVHMSFSNIPPWHNCPKKDSKMHKLVQLVQC